MCRTETTDSDSKDTSKDSKDNDKSESENGAASTAVSAFAIIGSLALLFLYL